MEQLREQLRPYPNMPDAGELPIEIVMKANHFLFEIMPEIQHFKSLENWIALLIPSFIENLGSPKVSFFYF